MCDCLPLEPFTAQREWTVDGVPVLTAELSLPRPAARADRASRRIERYYQLYARSYLRYCERWLLPQAAEAYRAALETSAPLPCGRAELAYQVTCNGGGVLSLFTETREHSGGGTERRRRGDAWDLRAGCPIPLSACFPRRAPWRKALLDRAGEELEARERAGMCRFYEGRRRLLRKNFNPENFYLTETELCWFYQMYALGPAAEGTPVFSIPFGENDCFFPGSRVKIEKTSSD